MEFVNETCERELRKKYLFFESILNFYKNILSLQPFEFLARVPTLSATKTLLQISEQCRNFLAPNILQAKFRAQQ